MLKNLLSYKIKIFASYFIINENIKKNYKLPAKYKNSFKLKKKSAKIVVPYL